MTAAQARTTRRLLHQLATPPAALVESPLHESISMLIDEIRSHLRADEDCDAPNIPAGTLHKWRTGLDQVLADFEKSDPDAWTHTLRPGTWLDSYLRLRSLLAHEVAKAHWDNKTDINYASIDVER